MNGMRRLQFAELDRRRRLLVSRGASFAEINREALAPRFVRRQLEAPVPGIEQGISFERLKGLMSGLFSQTAPVAEMTTADLIRLHESVKGSDEPTLRASPVEAFCARQEPVHPSLVPPALDRFFEWVGSESFSQLHSVEQIALAQMRLFEIHPFHRWSQTTCLVFSCRFLLSAGHLLPLPEAPQRFVEALSQAYAFSTEPLLGWNLDAGLRAYDVAEE